MLLHPAVRATILALPASLLLATGVELAAAQEGTSCRGSAFRGTVPGTADYEPIRANANASPCATDTATSIRVEPQNGFTATSPKADTVRTAGVNGASASVAGVTGNVGGTVPIAAGAIAAQQTVTCQAGQPVAAGSSSVESLSIGGTPVPGVVGSKPVDTTIPTPGGPIRIRANQLVGGTRTALILDLPGGQQQVFGEAIAGGDACLPLPGTGGGSTPGSGGGSGSTPGAGGGSGSTPGSGGGSGSTPGSGSGSGNGSGSSGSGAGSGSGSAPGGGSVAGPNPCPAGAEYDASRNVCVIRETLAGGVAGITVVSRPFQGPDGGTVITLKEARKRFGTKRCLTGAGPQFAVIGTQGNDRITGTNGRDRILTLGGNDRADGGRGDDCIDGGAGRDVLSGALGADRVYGEAGNDALNGGGSSDRLSGGTGNDTINSAYGADVVSGGSGRDAINVATAGPMARVDCGSGRDKVRVNNREKRRTRGCEVRYVLRDK